MIVSGVSEEGRRGKGQAEFKEAINNKLFSCHLCWATRKPTSFVRCKHSK